MAACGRCRWLQPSGCSRRAPGPHPSTVGGRPIVYGADDRLEYFEVIEADRRAALAQGMVALVPKALIWYWEGRP
jgi:hypothetical protein